MLRSLVELLEFVQIYAQAVEYDYNMLSESKVVNHVYQAIVSFVVVFERLHQFLKQPDLDVGIINVKLFVFAYLGGHYALVWIFVINTFDDLAESAFVYRSNDLVSVADLLALFY